MTFSMYSTLRRAGAILAAVGACAALPAQASLVSYTVDVTIDSGPRDGEHFTGNFTVNDATGVTDRFGDTRYVVSSFSFGFGGNSYSLADVAPLTQLQWTVSQGVAALEGGFKLDIFAFIPFTGFDPYFTYDEGNGNAGTGTLVYTPSAVNDVPEPASLALVALALAGLTAAERSRRTKR